MSVRAITWAFDLDLKPSTLKFLLVALADAADDRGLLFPSNAHLVEKTGLDRKTVQTGIADLMSMGLIEDTGERTGRTGQIRVLQLVAFKPENRPANGHLTALRKPPRNGQLSEDPNSPADGHLAEQSSPPADGKVPVYPPKGARPRGTEPSGTVRNPERERAHDDAGAVQEGELPNWRTVAGINADALLTWSTFRAEQGDALSDLQLRETAILLVAMGDAAAQRAAVSFSVAGKFRSIRQAEGSRVAQQQTADRLKAQEEHRDRIVQQQQSLRELNDRADRCGYKRFAEPDNFSIWLAGLRRAEADARARLSA